ncbi:PTS glucose transporter subunit IIA [Corynebacterium cystitidis]|uniref:PTS system IIA component, Glc family (TC 4.A.1)/PTS system IIB component, Glc family (TC 4.A.1)/PTS system IIC component, Glc family (TC 4.A.1) n=1 Tax=Corynebacterium cystitidis DSM 20524 TaxID=1121357 RepID=A0A1H9V724_9CORY|nr:PTS glucose transporter subunit IIA [Corynebacterium cystitidis]WJY83298.1 PTS system beta-glucoside-specific EIIBCA component [Corynebacterium cystitidis DSM 20524]SES17650.1 PTS system IIA component, Glc family (TC 4.A.1)/PTS system IIB component, Glc family (TC 4.A.1)/PTS system IIC component, Glc family (TC 4.A.1) [Corynebacterium cystitidis DSM 20524]SNV63686.1 PTS system, glucose-specific IIABC component [Corynebacterium cystitidis]
MSKITLTDQATDILEGIGGADNIASFTHCATRLRFELRDQSLVDKDRLEANPKVMGAVPQGTNNYQVIIGGDVATVYNEIQRLPEMRNCTAGGGNKSDADIKAEARSKTRGKYSWLDSFFEYLSDSFRPLLGVLLGASLIIAFTAVMEAFGVVDTRADDKAAGWVFIDAMWRSVFYFLPVFVAYNAGKKLNIDAWVPATVIFALMTPNFIDLKDHPDAVATVNEALGTEVYSVDIFGLPLLLNDYGGNVFVPLIMAPVAALVYKGLQKVIPSSVHMVFVPFLTLVIVIPLTAFVIGPFGIWLGNIIGVGLAWLNGNAPFVFAILIPMLYPFLVPLGLHWPLNALMLVNINTLGYDFIQGPMGVWNFACFGATAGVLILSMRDRDPAMRQTAGGALAAGLFGSISEPSLYGIHLRYKKIYPRMLVGCFLGGVTIAVLSAGAGGVTTKAFVFTSLLTTVVFSPIVPYLIAIAVAFFVPLLIIVATDYRTPEEKEEALARARAARETEVEESPVLNDETPAEPAAQSAAPAAPTATTTIAAPISGEFVAMADLEDAAFASGALGEAIGIVPDGGGQSSEAADGGGQSSELADGHGQSSELARMTVVAPVSGTVISVVKTKHAYGLKTDDGVEILVHIGIDTVKMKGEGFTPAVEKKQYVTAGDPLATVDFNAVETAGFDTTVVMTVVNSKSLTAVEATGSGTVVAGDPVISVDK